MRRQSSKPITVSVTFDEETFKRFHRPWAFTKAKSAPVGLISFICCVFEANELTASAHRPKNPPLTDQQIAALIVSQFPHKKNDFLGYHSGNKRPMTINAYRQRYNRGQLRRDLPTMLSFRYNKDGKRVNGRSGKRVLTGVEIAARLLELDARKANNESCKTH